MDKVQNERLKHLTQWKETTPARVEGSTQTQ